MAGTGSAAAQAPAPPQTPPAPVIAAVGDIACGTNNPRYNEGLGTDNSCQQLQTSNLLLARPLAAVLALGDIQYDQNGSLQSYLDAYEPTWGRLRPITRPVVGNHEYDDGLGAQGYWDYFNGIGTGTGPAGARGQGWYAYDVGAWRLIALNSNCEFVACLRTSRQLRFLRDELERNQDRCTLAYMHHPRFSSGIYEEAGETRAFWRELYRGGADVVLAGHDHLYERFAPQRPSGIPDLRRGVAQFTVGTGGYFLFPISSPPAPNSQFAYNQSFGVLFMRLRERGYAWSFGSVPNGIPVDGGSRACRNRIDLPPARIKTSAGGGDGGKKGTGAGRRRAG